MPWRERASSSERGSAQRIVLVLVVTFTLVTTIGYAAWRGGLLTADPAGSNPVASAPGSSATPSTGTVSSPPTSGIELPTVPTPPPVLSALEPTQPLSSARLQRRLAPLLASPALGRLDLVVAPLTDDGRLWSPAGEDELVTPASTLKLLTATTALELLGPDRVFQTSVVSGRSPHSVVLVGGGDPLLTDVGIDDGTATTGDLSASASASAYPLPASLEELAGRTASALRSHGVHRVRLSYDDFLFSGPAVNPTWPRDYLADDIVSPVTALWVDEGRESSGYAGRVVDPSTEAAKRFRALLGRAGIRVLGQVARRAAPAHSRRLASVASAPLGEIVQHVLELSDNEGAEVLLRQAAISSGRPGSFESGVRVVKQTVERLGVDLGGATLYDGSGLSRRDLVPVGALVDVLQVAADPAHPELRIVISSLPVAGFTGSLDYRFVDDAPSGLGLVRAKTGTLTGVHALAGVMVSADSAPLAFAAVANRVPVRLALDARAQLDRIAASLATCRCARPTG